VDPPLPPPPPPQAPRVSSNTTQSEVVVALTRVAARQSKVRLFMAWTLHTSLYQVPPGTDLSHTDDWQGDLRHTRAIAASSDRTQELINRACNWRSPLIKT
jgi:hypothetical protein